MHAAAIHAMQGRRSKGGASLQGSTDGPSACTSLCLGVVATGLLALACFMFSVSLADDRDAAVNRYADAIANWTYYRRQLNQSSFSLGEASIGQWVVLPKDVSADEFHDEEQGKGLPSYEPLRFSVGEVGSGVLPSLNFSQVDGQQVTLQLQATHNDQPAATLALEAVPLWTKSVVHAATPAPQQKCPGQQHGIYVAPNCVVFRRVTAVCVQVKLVDGQWQLHREKAGQADSYGCDLTSGKYWKAVDYAVVQAQSYTREHGQVVYHFSDSVLSTKDVQVTVRSSQDPYVQAQKATDGSLDFGISSKDALITAIVLLVVGLLLGVQPTLAVLECYRNGGELPLLDDDEYAQIHNSNLYEDEEDSAFPSSDHFTTDRRARHRRVRCADSGDEEEPSSGGHGQDDWLHEDHTEPAQPSDIELRPMG